MILKLKTPIRGFEFIVFEEKGRAVYDSYNSSDDGYRKESSVFTGQMDFELEVRLWNGSKQEPVRGATSYTKNGVPYTPIFKKEEVVFKTPIPKQVNSKSSYYHEIETELLPSMVVARKSLGWGRFGDFELRDTVNRNYQTWVKVN